MSVDYTGASRTGTAGGTGQTNQNAVSDAETSLFPSNPVWERAGKRRGFGGRRAAPAASSAASTTQAAAPSALHEPRSFTSPGETSMHDAGQASRVETANAGAATAGGEALVAPIGRAGASTTTRSRSVRRGHAAPATAIALGVLSLGAIGAAGWYATQGDDGVAELTPGAPTMAAAPATPVAGSTTLAMNDAAPPTTAAAAAQTPAAAEPARTTTRASATTERRTTGASRARPTATAASASEAGVNASATTELPAGPQPYSTVSGTGTTITAPSATTSGTAATTVAPMTPTPAPIPSTPPTLTPAPGEAVPSTTTPPPEPSTTPPTP